MRLPRTSLGAVCLAVLFSLASCQGSQEVCAPTDPLCGNGGGGGGVRVASVTVTSSIDSVVAVGGPQATMTAEARDASNNLVSVTFTWSSVTTSTATVDSSTGVVTALAAGTTTIRAAPDNGSVVGDYTLRAVTPIVQRPDSSACFGTVPARPSRCIAFGPSRLGYRSTPRTRG